MKSRLCLLLQKSEVPCFTKRVLRHVASPSLLQFTASGCAGVPRIRGGLNSTPIAAVT